MKSEERHELQQNSFETFLYYRLPHYLRQYGSYILLVAALAFLGYRLWSMHEDKKAAHISLGWSQFIDAKTKALTALGSHDPSAKPENPVESFNDLITNFADVPAVAGKAHFALGVYYKDLIIAGNPDVGGVKTSKEDAARLAQEQFDTIIQNYADQPGLIAETKLAEAALLESQQKFDDAQKVYQELTAENGPYAGSAYAAEAARKLARLPDDRQPIKYGPPSAWPRPSFSATAPATAPSSHPATAPRTTAPATTPK